MHFEQLDVIEFVAFSFFIFRSFIIITFFSVSVTIRVTIQGSQHQCRITSVVWCVNFSSFLNEQIYYISKSYKEIWFKLEWHGRMEMFNLKSMNWKMSFISLPFWAAPINAVSPCRFFVLTSAPFWMSKFTIFWWPIWKFEKHVFYSIFLSESFHKITFYSGPH